MTAENKVRLARMIENGEDVLAYAREGRKAFLTDQKLQDAVMWRLSNFTEEADKLWKGLARDNPRIDWRELSRLRQDYHHGYASIRPDDVWEFITRRLPLLVSQLRQARVKPGFPRERGAVSDGDGSV